MTFPKDYERYPEFRKIEAILATRIPSANIMANFLFLKIWTELAYQAARSPLGCIPKEEFQFFHSSLKIEEMGFDAPTLLDILKSSKLFREDGDNYFCLIFFSRNEVLSREYRAPQIRATDAVALKRRRETYTKNVNKDLAAIPEEYFAEVDGVKIEPAERNRIIVLIRCLDSIFSVIERDKKDFGVGLIHDASRVLRKFGAQKMEIILQRLLARRKMPGLPRTTEQFLSRIDDCVLKLEPESGWGEWSKIMIST